MKTAMNITLRTRGPNRATNAGTSMIEVLIALLILVFGVLGVAALQATALRNNQSAMEHSQAVVQTYAILDRMRANAAQAKIGKYNLGGPGATNWTCSLPDSGGLPENERREWIQDLQTNLGSSACGVIDCNDLNCLIGVQWDDSRGTSGSTTQQFITETRL